MKVKELLNKLSEFNLNADVTICEDFEECFDFEIGWIATVEDNEDDGKSHCDEVCLNIIKHILHDTDEVKHGLWIDTTAYCGEFTCSICKEMCVTNKYKYCPHCGAKMDGGKE